MVLDFSEGQTGVATSFSRDRIRLVSSHPFPPGARVLFRLRGVDGVGQLHGKSLGSRRERSDEGNQLFSVEILVFELTREIREKLGALLCP